MSDSLQTPNCSQVYAAISKVMLALSKQGIAKDSRNTQQNYQFRGIDDVYNALAPLLPEHGLVLLPKVKTRNITERTTKTGGQLFYVVLEVDYKLVSVVDGSYEVISVVGEAMDSGDKATNKAMSAAYKYACIQLFCIPTWGDNDADKTTHEPVGKFDKFIAKPEPKKSPLGDDDIPEWATLPKDIFEKIPGFKPFEGVPIHIMTMDDVVKVKDVALAAMKIAKSEPAKVLMSNIVKECMNEIMNRPEDKK